GDAPARLRPKPVDIYTDSEIETLTAAARGVSLRWWTFLSTLADTGRRVGEVLDVRYDCLYLDAAVPYIDLPTTKSRRQDYVPLTRRLREDVYVPSVLDRLRVENETGRTWKRDAADFLFPWTYASAQDRFRRFCGLVGITHRGFHTLRHSRATSLLVK